MVVCFVAAMVRPEGRPLRDCKHDDVEEEEEDEEVMMVVEVVVEEEDEPSERRARAVQRGGKGLGGSLA